MKSLSCLLFALSISACEPPHASSAAGSSTALPGDTPGLIPQLRQSYDRALDHVFAEAQASPAAGLVADLRALATFRYNHLGWAEMRGPAYHSLATLADARGMIAIVPPGNELLGRMVSGIQLEPDPTLNIVIIAPNPLNTEWASVLLIHEISHLYDRATGREPFAADRDQFMLGELRAYQLELAAARLLAPALDAVLDSALVDWRPESFDGLIARGMQLDSAQTIQLGAGKLLVEPGSGGEVGLRKGFIVAALLLRHGERRSAGVATMTEVIGRYMDFAKRSGMY